MSEITANDRVVIVKGCTSLGITKGSTAVVRSVTPLGAEYSHSCRVELSFATSFLSSRTVVLFARHPNRLNDSVVSVNNGNPLKKVQFRKA